MRAKQADESGDRPSCNAAVAVCGFVHTGECDNYEEAQECILNRASLMAQKWY
ncbi:hypothetical protein THO17_33410 [Marinomonas sp. THO17]